MLTSIVGTLLNSVNRFILGFLGQPEQVGLFSLASNISGIITASLIAPFQLAFNVIFWQKLKDSNAARFYTKSMTYSVFLYIWGAIGLSLLIPYAIKIYIPSNTAYWNCTDLVPILSLSLVPYGMTVISYMSYHYAKRNDLIFYFQAGALVINIVLNYLLIPYFQMYGAAMATFISFLLLISAMYLFSKRFYFIQYEVSKIVVMMLTAVVLLLIFYFVKIEPRWIDIIVRIIISLSFPLLLLIFKQYESVEINTIKSLIKRYF